MTPLWENRHPYYAADGNYYSNECHTEWDNWQSFHESMGQSDPDLNLVYRWDWDDEGGPDGVNYLGVFIVGQRKALLTSHRIPVLRAEEPVIREWLIERAKTIAAIWHPLALTLDESFLSEAEAA